MKQEQIESTLNIIIQMLESRPKKDSTPFDRINSILDKTGNTLINQIMPDIKEIKKSIEELPRIKKLIEEINTKI